MKHESEGRLMAFVDDALTPSERADVIEHLQTCYECCRRVATLRDASERLTGVLETLDAASPLDDLSLERAASTVRKQAAHARSVSARATLLRAAVLILGFAALASAAIPGTAVHDWFTGALTGGQQPIATEGSAADSRSDGTSGAISILPSHGRLTIRIVGAEQGSMLRVRLVEDARATIETQTARYRTGPGTVDVLDATGSKIQLDLPRSVEKATIIIDGRVVVTKMGDSLNWMTPEMSTESEVLLPLGSP